MACGDHFCSECQCVPCICRFTGVSKYTTSAGYSGTATVSDGTDCGWPKKLQWPQGDAPKLDREGEIKIYPDPEKQEAWIKFPEPMTLKEKHEEHLRVHEKLVKFMNKQKGEELPEGVEKMILYKVWMIYAEDREKAVLESVAGVIARNEEDAKIKSGLMQRVNKEWDADYLTFICEEIGDVKVKAKPKEVKTV